MDELQRQPTDAPSIGLILCPGRSKTVTEWALRGVDTPVAVARLPVASDDTSRKPLGDTRPTPQARRMNGRNDHVRALTAHLRRISAWSECDPTLEASRESFALARQPIFGRAGELVGHRLVSATPASGSPGGYLASMPKGADDELLLAEELDRIAPRGLVFLSVSRAELLELRALSLPATRFSLCLRADAPLDEDLSHAVDRHSMRGFRLALEGVDRVAQAEPLAGRAATAIVDVGPWSVQPLTDLVRLMRERLRLRELMATGVHSRGAFESCRRLGFDLFQGQFFLKPTSVPRRRGAVAALGGLGSMAELAVTENFEQLVTIITRDPGLSLRLLRYANSAHVALPRRVGSVHEAMAWLGVVTVREFALIAAVANIEAAPAEMLVTALTRARMCQELARRLPGHEPEEAFTVGLFSVAEAVANAPIAEALRDLPLREDVISALTEGVGELGELLRTVIKWERADFASARELMGGGARLSETYLEAVRWADSAVAAVA